MILNTCTYQTSPSTYSYRKYNLSVYPATKRHFSSCPLPLFIYFRTVRRTFTIYFSHSPPSVYDFNAVAFTD